MFHIQTRFKRSVTMRLAAAALCAGLLGTQAHALSCASTGQSAKELMPTIIGNAQRIVIGRITHKGATIEETWRARSLATIAVERDFSRGGGRSFQVMVPAQLTVGARVLVFAYLDARERAQPKGAPPRLMADAECGPSAFVMGSKEAQDYLAALEALPPAGQGGTLRLRLRAVPIGRGDRSLDAQLSEAGAQTPAPRQAAGQPPLEINIQGPHAQRRLVAQWQPRKGDEGLSYTVDHLPAGPHAIVWPELPGYTLTNEIHGQPSGRSVSVVDRGLQSRSLRYEPNATLNLDVRDDLGRPVQLPFGLILKRLSALDPSLPFPVPQEHFFLPNNDERLPSGLYRVDIALPQARHRVDADGKLHWTVLGMQRWPVATAQAVQLAPGANQLAITLPASLRPIRVRVVVPACKGRSTSVSTLGVVLGDLEAHPMGALRSADKSEWGNHCLLSLDALPGQALSVGDMRDDGFGKPRQLGIDAARAWPYLLRGATD